MSNEEIIKPLITLDVAVLKQNSSVELEINTDNHEIILQPINVTHIKFQELFYPTGTNFILDPQTIKNSNNIQYTSLKPLYRLTNEGYPFDLYNSILSNTESDLNVTRNMFTKDSLVSLTKELSTIDDLSDIHAYCVDDALNWHDLLSLLKNALISYSFNSENLSSLVFNVEDGDSIIASLVVNCLFRSPNMVVKPTVVRMNYNVSFPKTYLEGLGV